MDNYNSIELNLYINNCCVCLEKCNEIIGCCNGFIHKKCCVNIFTHSKTLTIHCPLCRKNVYLTSSNEIIFNELKSNIVSCDLNRIILSSLQGGFVKKCSMVIFILLLICIFIIFSKIT